MATTLETRGGRPAGPLIAALLMAAVPAMAAAEFPAGLLAEVFPGAERADAESGSPPAAAVYRDGRIAGYVFSTYAVTGSIGFSGRPLDLVVGLGRDGIVTGARVRRHDEPILIIGIPDERLRAYVAGFAGIDIREVVSARGPAAGPDAISGATISSTVIRDAILRSARAVARSRGLIGAVSTARLDREGFGPAGWNELAADGSLVLRRISRGAVDDAFGAGAGAGSDRDRVFIDLVAGLATPPRVGQNLLGNLAFSRLLATLAPDDQVVAIAANGLYSFKGSEFVRSGVFDRVQIVQGARTIRITRDRYLNVERFRAGGAPEFREAGLFVVPADTGFDPLAPWRLELLVTRETAAGGTLQASFAIDYALPDRYRIGPPAEAEATPLAELWRSVWRERSGRVAVLALLLVVLTGVLVFQDTLVRSFIAYRAVRLTFLAVTFLWLGLYAKAQLSVVNVLTFAHALLTGFRWEFFLLDPMIFVLWSYVAVTLLFWGRGVFCGWLCPFGALQELLSEGARKLRLPQVPVPFLLHERLWPIKYIVFLGLFAVSLHSTTLAVLGAEVEPFKTVISLKLVRPLPFVAYVVALLAAGLFIERFFCRYLCPLGAALAIPARLRMFEWLKRRHQCGRECGICAQRCTVQAIHPSGAINSNECIHCLNCQTLYYNDRVCPPLVNRRKRREVLARSALPALPRGDAGP